MNLNVVQQNPELQKRIKDFLEKQKEAGLRHFVEAHKKAQESAKKMKGKSKPKTGSVSISNTDTRNRCVQIKARLSAKLTEIFNSDLDLKVKMALAKDIMLQMDKVEQKIAEITKREKALLDERTVKKNESPREKRKRQYDLQKRTAYIRRDYLYSAEEGGFCPDSFGKLDASSPAVSFEIGGKTGEIGLETPLLQEAIIDAAL